MRSYATIKVPRLRTFDWPPRGSIECMGQWTFDKGVTSFDARTTMQNCQAESPLISPKGRPLRRDHSSLSPYARRSRRKSQTGYSESHAGSVCLGDYPPFHSPRRAYLTTLEASAGATALRDGSERHSRKDTHPPSQCFHCGLPWLHARQLSPTGDSSHWFIDIHDGVNRKMAYLFCWRCVDLVQKQMRPRHVGCGHYFSPPFLSTADKLNREDLMLCVNCRESLRKGLKSQLDRGQ